MDIVAEIPRLSTAERLLLIDVITRSLRESLVTHTESADTIVDQLHGAFNPGGRTFSDETLDQLRLESLVAKHA